ncbi:MAG: FkbM family methyltransferase [Verrucomicrobia bacterium]|nr:FkbM family methyltransferase [Verrucomicrobiota bacterium]
MSKMHGFLRKLIQPAAFQCRYWRHRLFPCVGYAADREDELIWLLLGRVDRFTDIGANDGFTCSNTFLFAIRGAEGLCFEPDPANYSRLAWLYRMQQKVRYIPVGISDKQDVLMMRCDGLLSTITATEDAGLEPLLRGWRSSQILLREVHVTTLAHWFNINPDFGSGDVLSIDVEGHEWPVLKGIDWLATPKPARCIIIETHAFGAHASWRHRDYDAIDSLLASYCYTRVVESANNTIWLHADDFVATRIKEARMRLPQYNWLIP